MGLSYHSTNHYGRESILFSLWIRNNDTSKIDANSLQRFVYEQDQNNALIRIELDLLEERREQSQLRIVSYQQCIAQYYNSKVRRRGFEVGDLVLRQVLSNNKEHDTGVFGPFWEGTYVIDAVIRPGTYKLARTGG
ncbi:hypothetical protein PanWU01x14_072300 [Parasponia andersonii]|uniref:Uncharacterized protein n=1 Tax=Parasponia andersonii TaxID=3476 RepID=A0A2P5DDQ9_PARAD|nr:hypothetical protein PanWU01x14_072300 [Parasponia andersonii]